MIRQGRENLTSFNHHLFSYKNFVRRINDVFFEVHPNKYRTMWKFKDTLITFSTTEELETALELADQHKKILSIWLEFRNIKPKKKKNYRKNYRNRDREDQQQPKETEKQEETKNEVAKK